MLLIGKHSLRRLCRHDVGIDGRRSRDRQPIGAAGQELVRIAGGRECWDNRDVGRAIRRKPLQSDRTAAESRRDRHPVIAAAQDERRCIRRDTCFLRL
jgi:hypothetical protein